MTKEIQELLNQLKEERKDKNPRHSAIKLILHKLHELRDDQLETNVNESCGYFYTEKIGFCEDDDNDWRIHAVDEFDWQDVIDLINESKD
jgi:hypothetical protein